MAAPIYVESLIGSVKRLRLSPPKPSRIPHCSRRCLATQSPSSSLTSTPKDASVIPSQRRNATVVSSESPSLRSVRLPKSVQAAYLAPLRRPPTHGLPVCDLQLRSYSLRNLEVYADFAMRAAYYLGLPAKGPVPLPKRIERWTTIRGNFVHKKSQENFERVTYKRLVQIQDSDSHVVGLWLAYLRKNQYYGVGMKANLFQQSGLEMEDGPEADLEAETAKIEAALGQQLTMLESQLESPEEVEGRLVDEPFKAAWGAYGPMGGAGGATGAESRYQPVKVVESERGFAKRKEKSEGASESSS
ncbi:hypothetical protein B0A48_10084 [Cryoendolithus antarcticus]|uniref:Small ribosomal subunit protein uS10m n=1 Tax=Cryoendolithus antarcticus TaxID=1507870 RepID=A0A1V8SWK5_9PEZI|nr:hypothetical protein B0A48_10084 [Cryoendolithus antarcticus]